MIDPDKLRCGRLAIGSSEDRKGNYRIVVAGKRVYGRYPTAERAAYRATQVEKSSRPKKESK